MCPGHPGLCLQQPERAVSLLPPHLQRKDLRREGGADGLAQRQLLRGVVWTDDKRPDGSQLQKVSKGILPPFTKRRHAPHGKWIVATLLERGCFSSLNWLDIGIVTRQYVVTSQCKRDW